MGALWVRCGTCGSVVADEELHYQWHRHGEQVADGDDERA